MIPIKQLVVATDFSETSEAAMRYGRELVRRLGARLHVLHVADDVSARYAQDGAVVLPPEIQADIESAAQIQLERQLSDDDRRELAAVAVLRKSNAPAETIVNYATAANIDVIVIGTHGRRGLAHLLLGSVAERVVRTSRCPVLVVGHPEGTIVRTDGS